MDMGTTIMDTLIPIKSVDNYYIRLCYKQSLIIETSPCLFIVSMREL